MDKLREAKLRSISNFLFKWCDPKPEYAGVSSMYLADLLLKNLKIFEIGDFDKRCAEEEIKDNEKRLAYQYDSDAQE